MVCVFEDAAVVGVESDVGSMLIISEIEGGIDTGELVVLMINEGVTHAEADDNAALVVDTTGLAEFSTDDDADKVWRT